MNKENWQEEYWKLWGHLKDTPMAKEVYSFILKALQTNNQSLLKKIEEIIDKEKEKLYNDTKFYDLEDVFEILVKLKEDIKKLIK